MSTKAIHQVELEGDGRLAFEKFLAQGRCCKADISAHLPRPLATLDISALSRDYADAPVQSTEADELGRRVRLGELCAGIQAEDPSDRSVANDGFQCPRMGNAALAEVSIELTHALEAMPLFSSWRMMASLLWIGGTGPGLHYDAWDNVLIQIAGRKRLILYDPEVTRQVRADRVIFAVNQEEGRIVGPEAEGIPYFDLWLEPGDCVAIPCGSLHSLEGSSDCVSLNSFLKRGPLPRHLRLRFSYYLSSFWPDRTSALVPARVRRWLARRAGITFFERHYRAWVGVPRKFRRRSGVPTPGRTAS